MEKKLAEMQRRAKENTQEQSDSNKGDTRTPREILVSILGYRGLEVLENAEKQFPSQTAMVVSQLAALISSGELKETLDGGSLLYIFRIVGLSVRMDTRISVEKDGKMVSLTDKLRGRAK